MPRHTIQVLPTDTVRVDMDWNYPAGIWIGDLRIALIGPEVVGKMLAALTDLQRELDDQDRREAGEPTEAEHFSNAGPEICGFFDERGAA